MFCLTLHSTSFAGFHRPSVRKLRCLLTTGRATVESLNTTAWLKVITSNFVAQKLVVVNRECSIRCRVYEAYTARYSVAVIEVIAA